MKKPIDVGAELLKLHQRYITEDKKPRYDFPPGERNLNYDEIFEITQAVWHAPRIGRIASSRKRPDELIAIPRGLADWLIEETARAREAQNAAFLDSYRKNYKGPTAEERMEMEAAFGKETTVVNVITGKKTRL